MNTNGNNQFRPEEIVIMNHFDKKTGEWIESEYPKVGGRLRIAHEQNGTLGITSEVIQYDGSIAVIKALCTTDKGVFTGIGMASLERDERIAPAILELAETRAIARALRFSGVGVEYCSAEEISHLDDDTPSAPAAEKTQPQAEDKKPSRPAPSKGDNGGNGSSNGNNGGNGGTARLSQKQHSFLLRLADERGVSRKALDDMSKDRFGCVVNYLSKTEASSLIGEMTAN